MTRLPRILPLAVGLLLSQGRAALGQHPSLSVAAHIGYNFNDLNEVLLGGQAIAQLTPFAGLNAGASAYPAVSGSLWMGYLTVRVSPLARMRALYFGAGVYTSRAANGTARASDTGFIGTLGVRSAGRLHLFGEVQLLKVGALGAQGLTGLGVRIW